MAAAAQAQCASRMACRRQPAAAAAAAAARPLPPRRLPARRAGRRSAVVAASSGFHQSLLVATERPAGLAPLAAPLEVREAEADDELQAAAWLRALSFGRYPEERKFAAEVHRTMVAEEEYKLLKMARINRKLDAQKGIDSQERSACLVALYPADQLAGGGESGDEPIDSRLLVDSTSGSGNGNGSSGGLGSHSSPVRGGGAASEARPAPGQLAVVGTLDLHAVRALPGEVLIGNSQNAAYLANVCTANAARRRGVGAALLQEARRLAARWGVDALYVHTMAVNEIACSFYERHGFVVEKEESSNQAHYRGRCLDGIEGRGRTLLLRAAQSQGRDPAPRAQAVASASVLWGSLAIWATFSTHRTQRCRSPVPGSTYLAAVSAAAAAIVLDCLWCQQLGAMANILRGYGLAREQGYFKIEQEADLQRHKQRLVKQGKLPEEPSPTEGQEQAAAGRQQGAAGQAAGSGKGFTSSEAQYEVLAEVLQQQARLDDPQALRRKEYERRVKGEPPPLSEAELMRARSKLYALGAAVGHVPRMSMGRNRWGAMPAAGGGDGMDLATLSGVRQMTPEAREVASRTYVAGVRALVYGSLLGAIGLAAAVTWATRSMDIRSGEDLGDRMRAGLGPLSTGARLWLEPMKARLQGWLGPSPASASEAGEGGAAAGSGATAGRGAEGGLIAEMREGGATAEFSRRLQQRYNTKKAGESGSSSGTGEL
ncbi:hypothetical protein COHA_006330 [Chlorella ohadii]|uniref:N-acetyltransferase domain-containing protein n=1 Tax=Chlorella ohadii TaxID=2649997 RepID=A0AAD5DMZ3_9CHLO|nr:hypothetical protein COHA_006330 [Chlorella ohadii]